MNKQAFQKVYHNFRYETRAGRGDGTSNLPCGDQDAAHERHQMYMENMMDNYPVLRAVQAQLDGRDQLAWKAEDPWNLRHHYNNLKRKMRRQ